MEIKNPRVLIVDDEPNILKTISICLDDLGFVTTSCQKPQQVTELIRENVFDLAFVDLKMAPIDGMEVLRIIRRRSPQTTVVIITAHGSVESAVEAIKLGAYDYLQKPFDFVELQLFAQKVLQHHNLKSEVKQLREQLAGESFSGDIITRNAQMREMIHMAGRVAETSLSVLIEGESGTGKELFARLIYRRSSRSGKPYVKVNCAALPENLLESELFGHVKGAFTGAVSNRKGRFEMADGGTLFLDEIAEISPALQVKLLRVLQQQEFERVGESKTRKVDIRIIAATNKNLDEALKEGTFRDDLFYRLNSVRLRLSPLRERPEDVPLLIEYFAAKFAADKTITFDPQALRLLRSYRWSGNVRELENVIERTVLLARGKTVYCEDLPADIRNALNGKETAVSLEEMEKNHIRKVLQAAQDLNEAAAILGVDPATLWRKRKKYNL